MFAVIFEVNPKAEQWDSYLGYAKLLRTELEQIDGLIDNERFSSLSRSGWLLSLSIWRDEKAVVRWRTSARHHDVQQNQVGAFFTHGCQRTFTIGRRPHTIALFAQNLHQQAQVFRRVIYNDDGLLNILRHCTASLTRLSISS